MTFFRESFIGSNFFAAFVPPSATQWVRVEVSIDLTNWTERAQAIATRAHLFADEGAAAVPRRFFRLALPGASVLDARQRWEGLGTRNYRFRFSTIPTGAKAPSGIVTVADGRKTLSELQDAITMEPLTNIAPAAIPDVDELFAMIAARTSPPAEKIDCRVVYDLEKGFPIETVFLLNFPEAWRVFRISEFEVLDAATSPE